MNALSHIAIIAPLVVAFGSRSSLPEEQGANAQARDSLVARPMTAQVSATRADSGAVRLDAVREQHLFMQSLPFRVLQRRRNNDANSSMRDTTACVGWSLTEGTCTKVLGDFVPISGYDWGELFDVLPCQCEGELEQADGRFKFVINAGSWFSVQCGDTTLYFGDIDKKFKKHFISTVWSGG
ncbi:MAG: hypothetical protein KA791_09330 [Flavobacteriales bacterium]|nr:hypothetical protein [Flavobacteriales bacterium]